MEKQRAIELPEVQTVRAMDLTPKELAAMAKAGQRIPLSARIGRGPMFIVPKAQA